MTLSIRTMTLDEVAIADAIAVAAFAAPRSRGAEIRAYVMLQPDGYFLAWQGESAVGMGGVVHYGPFAYIGMMAVLPEAQRQGIGLAIMRHILAWIEAHGNPVALLDASDAGAPLYAGLGFVTDDQSEVWELTKSEAEPAPRPTGERDGALPLRSGTLPALVAFDRPRFGADRGAVLSALLRAYPERALVTGDDAGAITGFLFAQPHQLGPWMAATPEDAARLLRRALALPFTDGPRALVPANNHDAIALLRGHGFARQRVLRHMRLGGSGPRSRMETYGLASFALG